MNYYLKVTDYGSIYPTILSEDEIAPETKDDYVWFCEAESHTEAISIYYEVFELENGYSIAPVMDEERFEEMYKCWLEDMAVTA